MKRVLITGGATNEYIDEVMKITNMSTGKLAVNLTSEFLRKGCYVTLIINKNTVVPDFTNDYENFKRVAIETTEDMLVALQNEATEKPYDIVVHSAAVADYKCDFVFRLEDLAEELYLKSKEGMKSPEDILSILQNPTCKVGKETKISSYQPNLTVKLGLTPKLIASMREMFPDAVIAGFKLLENVNKQELFSVAKKLLDKNNLDVVFANDLADLRQGKSSRFAVRAANEDDFECAITLLDTAESMVTFLEVMRDVKKT